MYRYTTNNKRLTADFDRRISVACCSQG